MIEHRTQPLSRELMLTELAQFCASLAAAGVKRVTVMFGWDSNLKIDEMWQDVEVPLSALRDYLENAEGAGTIEVGKADIFIKTEGVELTLCHEGDLHITGDSALVGETRARWFNLGYEPYSVEPRA